MSFSTVGVPLIVAGIGVAGTLTAGIAGGLIAQRWADRRDASTWTRDVRQTPDPLAVFSYSATVSAELAARVEAEMTEQELAAVPTARPNHTSTT